MATASVPRPWPAPSFPGGAAFSGDCSHLVCSIYCPQFCDIPLIFPPPPPLGFEDSSPSLSPLLIALIGILAAAVLLAGYYTVASRFCRRRRARASSYSSFALSAAPPQEGDLHRDQAVAPPPEGLEDWVIRRIAVCRYKKGDGLVMTTDCPVCLAEFRDGESLRLLPDCFHAFHLPCIDPWLKTHTSCPICRATIDLNAPPPPPAPAPAPQPEVRRDPVSAAPERKEPTTAAAAAAAAAGEVSHSAAGEV